MIPDYQSNEVLAQCSTKISFLMMIISIIMIFIIFIGIRYQALDVQLQLSNACILLYLYETSM